MLVIASLHVIATGRKGGRGGGGGEVGNEGGGDFLWLIGITGYDPPLALFLLHANRPCTPCRGPSSERKLIY